MPSLQLGVDDGLDLHVSSLDGDEKLIAVSQLSTDVNVCVVPHETRRCCRVAECKRRHVER